MNRIKLTRDLCWAAGKDAGNASMRKGNRKEWNRKDLTVAFKEINRLLNILGKQKMYYTICAHCRQEVACTKDGEYICRCKCTEHKVTLDKVI